MLSCHEGDVVAASRKSDVEILPADIQPWNAPKKVLDTFDAFLTPARVDSCGVPLADPHRSSRKCIYPLRSSSNDGWTRSPAVAPFARIKYGSTPYCLSEGLKD